MLSAMKAMGCPDAIFVIDEAAAAGTSSNMNMSTTQSKKKKGNNSLHATRKAARQYITTHAMLPDARIIDINSDCLNSGGSSGSATVGNETNMLIRTLRSMSPKPVSWRAQRSYLLADALSVNIQEQEQDGAAAVADKTYRVQVGGYLRGRPMQVNSLMHLVGVGAGRIVKVWKGQPPSTTTTTTTSARGCLTEKDVSGGLSALNMSTIVANAEK